MRVVDKAEALALLETHARALVPGGGCVLCALAQKRDSDVVRESEHGVVVLDRFACRAGHLLVIARRHVEKATLLGWATYVELQRLGFEATHALERLLAPKRVFVAALGNATALPMSFPHYHLHVVPVAEDDERARPAHVLSWSSGVVVYGEEDAAEWVEKLRAVWPNSGENPKG
jgi:diadenosine tetraphosphate (Ap4A) HIT family hydrolase